MRVVVKIDRRASSQIGILALFVQSTSCRYTIRQALTHTPCKGTSDVDIERVDLLAVCSTITTGTFWRVMFLSCQDMSKHLIVLKTS